MNCYKCGQKISDQSVFCPSCDKDLRVTQEQNQVSDVIVVEEKKGFRIGYVLIPLVIMCCLGIGIMRAKMECG